jgi:hypothetical protein
MFRTSPVHHQERFVQAVFADFGMCCNTRTTRHVQPLRSCRKNSSYNLNGKRRWCMCGTGIYNLYTNDPCPNIRKAERNIKEIPFFISRTLCDPACHIKCTRANQIEDTPHLQLKPADLCHSTGSSVSEECD